MYVVHTVYVTCGLSVSVAQDGTYVVIQSGAFRWRDERRTDGGDTGVSGCWEVGSVSSNGLLVGSDSSVCGSVSSTLL